MSDDLRLFCDYFIGETTTIGYDYSGWNAATIADIYWLSGESPKRDAAVAANGSAPPVPGRKHNARLMLGQPGAMLMPGVGSIETPPGLHGLRYVAQSGMDL